MTRLPPLPALSWTPEGFPRSEDVGDVYFSGDGLSEKRAVFLGGCGLPDDWSGREQFTIAELGLGAGLNLLATWDLWRRTRQPGARLHFVSIEGVLMSATDAARIHALWPELADLSARLRAAWPIRARGMQRIALGDGVTLTLMVDDIAAALPQLSFAADAWFLDGFSPAKNPEMWCADVMAHVARLSASGARLASYAVAGDVRRNLEAAGFRVERKQGHGRKKERLEAWRTTPTRDPDAQPSTLSALPLSGRGEEPGMPPPPRRGRETSGSSQHPQSRWGSLSTTPKTALVIGAGVAGCWMTRALLDRGVTVTLVDKEGVASTASGNPLALVMPRLDAADGPTARALIAAFLYARRAWTTLPLDAATLLDVRRLPGSDTERQRFTRLLADPPLDASLLEPLDPNDSAVGLLHHDSIAIRPSLALPALIEGATHRFGASVTSIDANTVTLDIGKQLSADLVIACAGMGLSAITDAPPLEGRLGQLEYATSSGGPSAGADGGYAVEALGHLVFGATFEPAPPGDPPIKPEARAENLETLARLRPDLDPAKLQLASRAAIRATTSDRFPFAGSLDAQNEKAPVLNPAPSKSPRLIGGLGARGFLWSPLLAEFVASEACGEPSPVENSVAALLDPGRFRRRALRRGG